MEKDFQPEEIKMAIGALLRMLARPTEAGDMARYNRIRALVMDASEERADARPNWAAQRLSGAAGD